jgi:hypothetical protein
LQYVIGDFADIQELAVRPRGAVQLNWYSVGALIFNLAIWAGVIALVAQQIQAG